MAETGLARTTDKRRLQTSNGDQLKEDLSSVLTPLSATVAKCLLIWRIAAQRPVVGRKRSVGFRGSGRWKQTLSLCRRRRDLTQLGQ